MSPDNNVLTPIDIWYNNTANTVYIMYRYTHANNRCWRVVVYEIVVTAATDLIRLK